jgi:uncharacterized lipoprotein YajG
MKVLLLSTVIVLLSGCAAAPPEQVASADQLVCTRETATGTSIPSKRCRTAEEAAKEKAAAQDALGTLRSRTPGGVNPGGG